MSHCDNPRCQQMHDQLVVTHESKEALTVALTKATQRAEFLAEELKRIRAEDNAAEPRIRFVFSRYKELCAVDARLGPKQAERIREALNAKWGGEERVLKAIRGAGRFPYVVNYRRCATGREDQKFVSLKFILGDEEGLQKCCDLADRADREDGIQLGRPWVLDLLTDKYGAEQVVAMADLEGGMFGVAEWWSPCPLHDTETLAEAPMRIRFGDGGVVELKCAKGCDDAEVATAVDSLRDAPSEQLRMAA